MIFCVIAKESSSEAISFDPINCFVPMGLAMTFLLFAITIKNEKQN